MQQQPSVYTIGLPFIELQSVDSTNNYARQQISAGLAKNGMVIFSHEQTKGKGQRGRGWSSEPGANIALSILVKPLPLLLHQQFQLSACVAVAVHEFFMNYAGVETKIKWPNDLYWQDRKAGGVLIESIVGRQEEGGGNPSFAKATEGKWNWAIVGIGININQTGFPDYLPNPVSLKQVTGNTYNVVLLAKELCEMFQRRFDEFITSGFENIFNTYNMHLYNRGEKVRLKKENRVFEARIKAITSDGKLMVHHAIEEEFDFGEVEWMV